MRTQLLVQHDNGAGLLCDYRLSSIRLILMTCFISYVNVL